MGKTENFQFRWNPIHWFKYFGSMTNLRYDGQREGTVGCQCTKRYEYYEDLEVWIRRIFELWNAIVDYMIWFSKQTFAFGALLEHGVNKPNCYLAPELEEWEEEFLYYGGWFWLSLIIIMIIIWSFSNNILFPCKDNCRFNL